ncbi:MAG: hypothetical protein ACHQ15_03805 [Candidatus Limnocylindrales bacterium]
MAPTVFPRSNEVNPPLPETGTVLLRLTRPGTIDLVNARRRLDSPEWLGVSVASEQPGMRRFMTDLVLPLRAGQPQTVFRKAAFVDLGEAQPTPGGLSVPIGWRSSTLAPLFPVFAGRLLVRPQALILEGCYAPPGGEAGRILDRALLSVAARGTARWFLEHVGAALEAATDDLPTAERGLMTEALQPR